MINQLHHLLLLSRVHNVLHIVGMVAAVIVIQGEAVAAVVVMIEIQEKVDSVNVSTVVKLTIFLSSVGSLVN